MFRRIILVIVLTASCISQNKVSNENVARMEQIVQSYVPSRFMGTVLVAQDGKVLLDKGYGFANLEWDIPNTPTTKFSPRIDYQAVHGGFNTAAGGARQVESRGPGEEIYAGRACRMGQDHHLPSADSHLGNSQPDQLS